MTSEPRFPLVSDLCHQKLEVESAGPGADNQRLGEADDLFSSRGKAVPHNPPASFDASKLDLANHDAILVIPHFS
jgi:hypothetical protein